MNRKETTSCQRKKEESQSLKTAKELQLNKIINKEILQQKWLIKIIGSMSILPPNRTKQCCQREVSISMTRNCSLRLEFLQILILLIWKLKNPPSQRIIRSTSRRILLLFTLLSKIVTNLMIRYRKIKRILKTSLLFLPPTLIQSLWLMSKPY